MKRVIKALIFALIVCVVIATVSGCGGSQYQDGSADMSTAAVASSSPQVARDNVATGGMGMNSFVMADEEVAFEGELMEEPLADSIEPPIDPDPIPTDPSVQAEVRDRKIIYTADVSLQTKEFDKGIATIEEMAANMGGFVQSSNVQGTNLYDYGGRKGARYAHYTLRIPQEKLKELLASFDEDFNVSYTNLYTDDITGNYYDIQARLDSLRVQQERLLEMLGKAEDVEYLIEVERELARVGYEIESLTSSIRRMDDSVSYSTVNVNIEEVVEYESVQPINATFGEQVSNTLSRAWSSFVNFCTGFVLFLVAALPSLIILVPLAVIVIWVILRRRRRRKMAQVSASKQPEKNTPNEGDNSPQA